MGRGELKWGKNFVSDGHFCTSICPAQPKINICTNFKHCHHVITYLDCVMSKNCIDLQNQRLRNQVIKAASVMELKTTRLKNGWAKKYCCQTGQVALFSIIWDINSYQLPMFCSLFQSQMSFSLSDTDLIKKYAFVHHWRRPCPSLTQNIDDPKWGMSYA